MKQREDKKIASKICLSMRKSSLQHRTESDRSWRLPSVLKSERLHGMKQRVTYYQNGRQNELHPVPVSNIPAIYVVKLYDTKDIVGGNNVKTVT